MSESLSVLDHALFLELNSWNTTWLNPLMVFFSSELIWLPFIVFIFFIAFRQLERKSFYLFIFFLALALVACDVSSSYILKNVFQRLRPCRVAEIKELMNDFGQKCGGKFGFVSSHAANSVTILSFASFGLRMIPRYFHFLWILPLIVSFSRIYLGVHYPGDILGGVSVGLFWGYVLARFFRGHESWGNTAQAPSAV